MVYAPTITPSQTAGDKITFAKVMRVYDGDTIQIDTGQKVRYIGIDAAEVYPVRICYSDEARKENEKLVLGNIVKLEKDVSETDKYGRLLRYVYIGGIFVNDYLVRNGFVKVMTVPPDIKFSNLFLESEKSAKENSSGLWGKCF